MLFMKMSSNIAKSQREKEEPEDPYEEDWVRNFIPITVILYCLMSTEKESNPVYNGQFTASNVGYITKVDLSDLKNISEPAET